MTDNLYFSEEAREKIMAGIKKCATAVGVTMGTAGQNSIIEAIAQPGFDLTNDGITILESIKLGDPLEELGRKFLVEAVSKANKSSGDGSSTTCVLTAAILEEGMKHLGESNAMEIKRSLEACIPVIEESIKKQAKTVTVDEVWKAASISAEDEEIGKRIGDIYKKIGKDGIINWEAAKVPEDSYEIGTGIKIDDAGYFTPYLCDVDPQTGWFLNEMRLKDVPVLLCAQKITSADVFNGLFSLLHDKGQNEIAIFVDEVTPETVMQLIGTRQQRGFRAALIKMPTLWKDEWWEDLSIASGGQVLSQATGITFKNLEESHLGHFKNIIVKKDSVVVDGTNDLSKHLMALKVEGSDNSLLRVARLNTKTARYFVGGHSESSISYRRRKVEDAINAASEALDGGVVAGGGAALRNATESFESETIGELILQSALREPMFQIMQNAGIDGDAPWKDNEGYDSKTGELVNMFDAGIVDPAKVVISAVKAAIGVAAGVLTLGTVVTFPPQEKVETRESLIRR